MSDEDEDLALPPEELQTAGAVDAGVFHLVEQHDRRVADHRGVGDEQGARLTAAELGHAHVQPDRLTGELVGELDGPLDHVVRMLARGGAHGGVRLEELAHGEVAEERGVLRDQGDGVLGGVVAELARGTLAVDQHPPHRRRVAVGEHLDVVDERRLARPRGADDAGDVAHLQVDALHGFGLAVFAAAADDGDALDLAHARLPVQSVGMAPPSSAASAG